MVKFARVLVLEVEKAKDKNPETPGGKYRRDSPWLAEAFRRKGAQSEIIFITRADTAASLRERYPDAAFLGRVNPMDYDDLKLNEYLTILNDLKAAGVLLGPDPQHMDLLGSKIIVYKLRDTEIGVDGVLFHEIEKLSTNKAEIDVVLPPSGPSRVIKMLRGSTGLGVWKLENVAGTNGQRIAMTDAYTQKVEEVGRDEVIPKFLQLCQDEAGAISMPFLPLIGDGELRFLMSREEVLEIVHKRPVDATAFTATLRSGAVYTTLDLKAAENLPLVQSISNWARSLLPLLNFTELPYWWSVDCIEEEIKEGEHVKLIRSAMNPNRRLVLSEINCSCLGLVTDTSPQAAEKGMKLANMIASIVLAD